MTLHIGVMAKAPVPGYTNTRLIPLLGADGAANVQREMTWKALGTACAAAPGAVTLFTSGDSDHPFWRDCQRTFGVECLPQAGVDLGERMNNAFENLLQGKGPVVLIGTDCPALTPDHIERVKKCLENARMTFIPAEDGGYVLVGARELSPEVFDGISWGSHEVMNQTRSALMKIGWQPEIDWIELPPLWDVDRPDDYLRAQGDALLLRVPNPYAHSELRSVSC